MAGTRGQNWRDSIARETRKATKKKEEVTVTPENVEPGDSPRWWLHTRWLEHRNSIQDIHPILLEIEAMSGNPYLTPANIRKLLDSKNPRKTARELRPELKEVES